MEKKIEVFNELLNGTLARTHYADSYHVIANDENLVFIQSSRNYVSKTILDDISDLCEVFGTSYWVESREVCGVRKMVIAVERP